METPSVLLSLLGAPTGLEPVYPGYDPGMLTFTSQCYIAPLLEAIWVLSALPTMPVHPDLMQSVAAYVPSGPHR